MSRYYEAHNGRRGLFIIDQETNQDVTNITDLLNQQDEKIKDLNLDIENLKDEIEEREKNFGKLTMEHCECNSLSQKMIEERNQKIKELEEENGYIMFEDGYDENGKEINKQTYITYKQAFTDAVLEAKRLRKENKKLESQLEEQKNINKKLDLENQKMFDKNVELCTKLNMKEHEPAFCKLADRECEYFGKVEELKQQLKQKFEDMPINDFIRMAKKNGYDVQLNEDKNPSSINELEKVKSQIWSLTWYDNYEEQHCIDLDSINEYIDERINELRGEK